MFWSTFFKGYLIPGFFSVGFSVSSYDCVVIEYRLHSGVRTSKGLEDIKGHHVGFVQWVILDGADGCVRRFQADFILGTISDGFLGKGP